MLLEIVEEGEGFRIARGPPAEGDQAEHPGAGLQHHHIAGMIGNMLLDVRVGRRAIAIDKLADNRHMGAFARGETGAEFPRRDHGFQRLRRLGGHLVIAGEGGMGEGEGRIMRHSALQCLFRRDLGGQKMIHPLDIGVKRRPRSCADLVTVPVLHLVSIPVLVLK